MRIVRAYCLCGYVSAKARDGRQFEHEWRAAWDESTQELVDDDGGRTSHFIAACPRCRKHLALRLAAITAICGDDCGHRYPWMEASSDRCPRCHHRPHRFETDLEPHLADREPIETGCRCACRYSCRGLDDAFCPRCGARPTRATVGVVARCLLHDTELPIYRPAADEAFWRPRYLLRPAYENARTCEPAGPGVETVEVHYCPACDALREAASAT